MSWRPWSYWRPRSCRSSRKQMGCPMPSTPETKAIVADPAQVHREATTVDGLVFMSDGHTADLKAGNVAAINLTVAHMESDFAAACDTPSEWRGRAPATAR